MQSIGKGLEELDSVFGSLLEEIPGMRREYHEAMAQVMERSVDRAISGSSLNDSAGRVRRWQLRHVGSGGGYAAIRPIGSKEGAATGRDGPGAITNYLEGGHAIRSPKGGMGYRPRIKVAYVNGFHFYQEAGSAVEAHSVNEAQRLVNRLGDRLEGR